MPRVLDVGCGDGAHTLALASALPHASVVGVDQSPTMIERARAAAAAAGVAERVSFVHADAAALPSLGDESFDVATSFNMLHWPAADDAPSIWRGIARALRPGGRAVAVFHGDGSMQALMDTISSALVGRGYAAEAFRGLTRFTDAEYEAVLADAGFGASAAAAPANRAGSRTGSAERMVRCSPFVSEMRGYEGTLARLSGAWGPMLDIPPPDGLWEEVAAEHARRHGVGGVVPLQCRLLHVDAQKL